MVWYGMVYHRLCAPWNNRIPGVDIRRRDEKDRKLLCDLQLFFLFFFVEYDAVPSRFIN